MQRKELEQRVDEAKRTGKLWICGEMEFSYPCSFAQASRQANEIAEACGYLASAGNKRLRIVGGDIMGEVILEWNDSASGPHKIEAWTPAEAWF